MQCGYRRFYRTKHGWLPSASVPRDGKVQLAVFAHQSGLAS